MIKTTTLGNSTKEKIERSAKKLFAAKGFASVTTREIAIDAGVNLSSLSYHFKSKELLLIHLANQFIEVQTQVVFISLSDSTSLSEFKIRLEVFIDSLIVTLLKDFSLFKLFHNEIERGNPILLNSANNPSRNLLPLLIKFFKNAQKNEILSDDIDAQMAAMIIFKEILQTVLMSENDRDFVEVSLRKEGTRKKWIQNLLRIILGGIQSDKNNSRKRKPI